MIWRDYWEKQWYDYVDFESKVEVLFGIRQVLFCKWVIKRQYKVEWKVIVIFFLLVEFEMLCIEVRDEGEYVYYFLKVVDVRVVFEVLFVGIVEGLFFVIFCFGKVYMCIYSQGVDRDLYIG